MGTIKANSLNCIAMKLSFPRITPLALWTNILEIYQKCLIKEIPVEES